MPSSSSTQRPQTFSNVQAQEASALLMLPQELRDKVSHLSLELHSS